MLDQATINRIITLRKSGVDLGDIRKRLGLTKGQVSGVVWRHGLCASEPETRKFWWEVVDFAMMSSPTESASYFGVPNHSVYDWFHVFQNLPAAERPHAAQEF